MTDPTENKCRVLLVEDEAMIAMLMEDMLIDLGCEVAASAGQVEEAIALAETGEFDVAFLDVNLRGLPVYPVAKALQSRGIPFAFVTGYGSPGVDADHTDAPVLQKPFQSQDLAAILRRLQAKQ